MDIYSCFANHSCLIILLLFHHGAPLPISYQPQYPLLATHLVLPRANMNFLLYERTTWSSGPTSYSRGTVPLALDQRKILILFCM